MQRKHLQFQQYLFHDIEDEDKAEEYIERILPMIGLIVMYFNGLESNLDSMLCEIFTDRTDSTGLIVLNTMNFSSKIELFKKFSDDFHLSFGKIINDYDALINNLKESARLRNLVVHANWESTNEEGYTYIRLKMSKEGMLQEYIQFSEKSLMDIIELIITTRVKLDEYWQERSEVLCF